MTDEHLGALRRMRFTYSWWERAVARDAVVAEAERQHQLVEIAAMQARLTALALALQNVAVAVARRADRGCGDADVGVSGR
jgi:hypothetical protein